MDHLSGLILAVFLVTGLIEKPENKEILFHKLIQHYTGSGLNPLSG